MPTLVCKTVDKASSFPTSLGSLLQCVSKAEQFQSLGCEPMYIYEQSSDKHYNFEWIMEQIRYKNEVGYQ